MWRSAFPNQNPGLKCAVKNPVTEMSGNRRVEHMSYFWVWPAFSFDNPEKAIIGFYLKKGHYLLKNV